MASTVEKGPRYRTSPRRDSVDRAYRQMVGSASPDAAHQRMRKVEREFLDLVRCLARAGAAARIARLQVLVEDAARIAIPCTTDACLLEAARQVHRVDQLQDTARFELPISLTPVAEEKLLRATYAEIAHLQNQAALLEARKASR